MITINCLEELPKTKRLYYAVLCKRMGTSLTEVSDYFDTINDALEEVLTYTPPESINRVQRTFIQEEVAKPAFRCFLLILKHENINYLIEENEEEMTACVYITLPL